jgi:hypothetical protein
MKSKGCIIGLAFKQKFFALAVAGVILGSSQCASAATYTFQIPSSAPWVDTGISVSAGSLLNLSASGKVYYGPFSDQFTNPNGGNWDGTKFFSTAVYPDTIVLSLIGKLGGDLSLGTGTPLPEGVSGNGFGFVGTSYSQIVSTSGQLYLGFNDQVGYFGDNSGYFTVIADVIAVPEPSVLSLGAFSVLMMASQRRRATP